MLGLISACQDSKEQKEQEKQKTAFELLDRGFYTDEGKEGETNSNQAEESTAADIEQPTNTPIENDSEQSNGVSSFS